MILLLEPTGGIAGDMFLAAALDLGVSRDEVVRQLSTLKLPGWQLAVTRAQRHGITGMHVDVLVDGADLAHPDHAAGRHEHPTNQGHSPGAHRPLSEIRAMISGSGLSSPAKARALEVFRVIGEAEAKIHEIPLEQVAFHEIGAVDSIVDICGAAIVLELLGNPEVFSTPPPLGSGTIQIAHGVVPVPVPATLEILRGMPVSFEGKGELTTPTGAALLKTFATLGPLPDCTIDRIGYGVGTRDWADRANVLRASLAHRLADVSTTVQIIEANLDDCTPQLLGALIDTLMRQGALDAWVVPATMKKGRPGHILSVLASESTHYALIGTILAESTTLGVRTHRAERTVLARRFEDVTTAFGKVRIKLGLDGERVVNAAPEFEDCRALAAQAKVPVKQVLAAAMAAWEARRPPG
jgi:uncharacterized protein (TIGR00299 family) protein